MRLLPCTNTNPVTGCYITHVEPNGITHVQFFRTEDAEQCALHILDLTAQGIEPRFVEVA